jgi:hypothetical protein
MSLPLYEVINIFLRKANSMIDSHSRTPNLPSMMIGLIFYPRYILDKKSVVKALISETEVFKSPHPTLQT